MKPRTTSAGGPMTESVEGRRPVEGRVKATACPGHRAGTGMSPTARAHGPELDGPPKPRMRLTFDRSPVRESRTPGSARGAGGNFRPLYVARCPAGDHIRRTARKAVSPRRPFGEQPVR